ncbi:hypothetical protein [Methyloligella solikamskensis]|uniref:Uncharacterized protein n=1 Tax=Methyloligella solikamskensis TaxID=1177756 RepID=A0ABW3JFS2_9HYPH
MNIEQDDPLREIFSRWRAIGDQAGPDDGPLPVDAAAFTEYAETLLSELEAMAVALELEELGSSLSLCKNVARLSGGGGSAGLTD